jgi:hypothetical protein
MNYITFSNLGGSGGLCSQLQIYAGLLAVAKANNKKIVFSEDAINGKLVDYITGEKFQTKIRVFELLDLEYEIKPQEFFNNFTDKHINFHTTTYDETLFSLDTNVNYNLVGRFDLYTYWYNDIKTEVEAWKYKKPLQDQAENRMSEIKKYFGNNNPTVSIHIRRGDYNHPNHHFCSLDDGAYYEKAIVENFLPIEDYNFIIFSNDINYAKEMFIGDNIWFVEPIGGEKVCTDSEKEDLALMSLCDHHITANSSYSWWGAFLCKNPNKKIICPTNWLKSYHPSSWINGNYYPPTWINIDNQN